MNHLDIDKLYVSPYDKFLFEFDIKHEKSASQMKEINKHRRIAHLRDEAQDSTSEGKLWEDF